METSEEPTFPGFEEALRSYPQVYPASRPPWPGSEEARTMTGGSGRQCSMLFETSSRLGLFSKILLESSLWGNSMEYCYVWNRLDTRFALSAFQLTPLGQSTEEPGCSLWRTPTRDASGRAMDAEQRLAAGYTLNLVDQAKTPKLWPTPCAQEDGKSPEAHLAMKARMKGGPRKTVTSLTVAAKLWPTPTVPNGGRRNPEGTSITGKKPDGGKAQIDIREFAIRMDDSPSGSLNPRFVEELMGFPIDHTALRHSATPSSRSKRSPSSRRSPKSKEGEDPECR